MSIQKDLEGACNQAMDAMDTVREKLMDMKELNADIGTIIDENAFKFVAVNTVLEDILSAIEDLDA